VKIVTNIEDGMKTVGNMKILETDKTSHTLIECHCLEQITVEGIWKRENLKIEGVLSEVIIDGKPVTCEGCGCTWQVKIRELPPKLKLTSLPMKYFVAYVIDADNPEEAPALLGQATSLQHFVSVQGGHVFDQTNKATSIRCVEVTETEASEIYYKEHSGSEFSDLLSTVLGVVMKKSI
jgi:hypothetical protein